jgi:O-acetyl-ADP-ribose deacetylase (regulator of RNase III)
MTITYKTGDIFKSNCKALVNPVNVEGVMGAGLAKQFKDRFPGNFEIYKRACDRAYFGHNDSVRVLPVPVFAEGIDWIVNLPTKVRWRDRSSVELIELGLVSLSMWLVASEVESIAIPALGCGLGKLNWWLDVKPLIAQHLSELSDRVDIVVFESIAEIHPRWNP